MQTLNEAFITHRTGKQPLLDTDAGVWPSKQIAGEQIETRNRRRAAAGLELRNFAITRVPAAKGHTAWTTSATREVIVGNTKKPQTWYGWECECGAGSGDDAAASHEDMAAKKAAQHVVETAGLAKPTPVVEHLAAPTVDTFHVSEGRQGSLIKGMTLVKWTVKNEDTTILRVETVSVGGKLFERTLTDAIAAAYGVEPALVALTTFKAVGGDPRSGQGVVGDWTPDMAPALAAEPTPEVSAAPAESAPVVEEPVEAPAPAEVAELDRTPEALVALAYDAKAEVRGREAEGEIPGKAFALSLTLTKPQARTVRSALTAAAGELGGAFSLLASKRKTAIVVPPTGVTPANWDAVLLVVARGLAEWIEEAPPVTE